MRCVRVGHTEVSHLRAPHSNVVVNLPLQLLQLAEQRALRVLHHHRLHRRLALQGRHEVSSVLTGAAAQDQMLAAAARAARTRSAGRTACGGASLRFFMTLRAGATSAMRAGAPGSPAAGGLPAVLAPAASRAPAPAACCACACARPGQRRHTGSPPSCASLHGSAEGCIAAQEATRLGTVPAEGRRAAAPFARLTAQPQRWPQRPGRRPA